MNHDPIPLVDLRLQHRRVSADVTRRMAEVMDSAAFILGPQVSEFEAAFAAYSGADHCLGVANGTDAVELALRGAGVGPGDEVIIPANTFVATAEAVVRAGATVVLADVDEHYLIAPTSVAEQITPATRAVVAVHLYGQMAPMRELRAAVGADILLVEDAAQSQGAKQWGRVAGSVGIAAGTSFYPGKNLGAYGDAGAVLTNSAEVADRIRTIRNHGSQRKYQHTEFGFNSRLDTLQAVVLSAKLLHLDAWNDERRAAAARYEGMLADVDGVRLPTVAPGNEPVWHLYVVAVDERDRVLHELNEAGIGASIHYPAPVHRIPPYDRSGQRPGDFPVAERQAPRILSLPLFPGITAAQQERVVQVFRAAVSRTRSPQAATR